jgi:Flp pilus assembly protein TadB
MPSNGKRGERTRVERTKVEKSTAEKAAAKRRPTTPRERAADYVPLEYHRVELGPRRLRLLLIAGLIIVIGFIALAAGETTLAPVLLVCGYLVMIPYALLARPKRQKDLPQPGDSR